MYYKSGIGRGRIVHTAAEYRKIAEECFEWAATALDDEVRANYLGIAQIWLQAASRLDGGLPIRGAVIPVPKKGDGRLDKPQLRAPKRSGLNHR
jgi:hypothetical protein